MMNFLSGLKEDTNGNIIYEKINNSTSEKHSIPLQYSSRHTRRVESKLDIILGECRTVKKKIIENLIFNIGNESQKNTIVEFSSAFDLQRSCDKATRLECLKKLFSIYGMNYSHKVLNESKKDYHAYNITVNYPPKYQCSENELISGFNSMWHHLNRLWLKYKDNPVVRY